LIRLPLQVSSRDGPDEDASQAFEDAREEEDTCSAGSDDGANARRPEAKSVLHQKMSEEDQEKRKRIHAARGAKSVFDEKMSEKDLEDMLTCCSKATPNPKP
jgi:hypothetical protein